MPRHGHSQCRHRLSGSGLDCRRGRRPSPRSRTARCRSVNHRRRRAINPHRRNRGLARRGDRPRRPSRGNLGRRGPSGLSRHLDRPRRPRRRRRRRPPDQRHHRRRPSHRPGRRPNQHPDRRHAHARPTPAPPRGDPRVIRMSRSKSATISINAPKRSKPPERPTSGSTPASSSDADSMTTCASCSTSPISPNSDIPS